MDRRYTLAGILCFSLLFVGLGCGRDKDSSKTDETGAATVLEAEALLKSAMANQSAAQRLYEGKRITLSGMIVSKGGDEKQSFVHLGTASNTKRVACELYSEYSPRLADLGRGDRIKVSGVLRMGDRITLQGARIED